MIAPLVLAIMAYCVVVAFAAVVVAVRRCGRPRWLGAGAWTLQALLVVQAVIAVLTVLGGHGPVEPALFLAYLAVAIALLPLCGAFPTGRAPVRTDAALAVAAVITLVVQWRLVATWRSGHA